MILKRGLILALLCSALAACDPLMEPARPVPVVSPTLKRLPKIKPYVAQGSEPIGAFTYEAAYKDSNLQGRLVWGGLISVYVGHSSAPLTKDAEGDRLIATYAANVKMITGCQVAVTKTGLTATLEPVLIVSAMICPPPVKSTH